MEIRNLLTNVTLQGTESDVWLWWHNISDGYTVRGVYQMLMRQEMHIHDAVTDAPWHKSAPLKVSFCVWRLLRNRWPTKDNLVRELLVLMTLNHVLQDVAKMNQSIT